MWSNNVVVHPWVGDRYLNPKNLRYRTLIVGESNFTEEKSFNQDLVKSCVADDLSLDLAQRDTGGFCRFATKLRRIVFGPQEQIGPQAFWPDVAFYNYVQALVGDAPRQRPTPAMWLSAIPAFSEIVVRLKPERILVLGSGTWSKLLPTVPHKTIDEHTASIDVGHGDVLAGYVNHPSSSVRYAEWHPVANRLLLR